MCLYPGWLWTGRGPEPKVVGMAAGDETMKAIPPGVPGLTDNGSERHGAAGNDDDSQAGCAPAGRRSRQRTRRSRRVEFSLTEAEFADLRAASARAGLTVGAYSAEATLAVAREVTSRVDSPLREALGEFIGAAGLVRRIGVNLNQAVGQVLLPTI